LNNLFNKGFEKSSPQSPPAIGFAVIRKGVKELLLTIMPERYFLKYHQAPR